MFLELGFIPPAAVRGNSRSARQAKAKTVRSLRRSGYDHAREWLANNAPLRPPYRVEYHAYTKRRIDADNLLIGYKPILDGIADSGAITDDGFVRHMSIETHPGHKQERSTIRIYGG